MNIAKQKNRLERIDFLLRQKNTGTSFEFAEKIGIGRTTLMDIIDELRSLGFPIEYNYTKKSYEYAQEGRLVFCFSGSNLDKNDMKNIKGGNASVFFEKPCIFYYKNIESVE